MFFGNASLDISQVSSLLNFDDIQLLGDVVVVGEERFSARDVMVASFNFAPNPNEGGAFLVKTREFDAGPEPVQKVFKGTFDEDVFATMEDVISLLSASGVEVRKMSVHSDAFAKAFF
jgi:hypothetical protein